MKIKNTKVFGIEDSIRKSGFPLSKIEVNDNKELEYNLNRASNLGKNSPGTGHNCYLKGIVVQADITATTKWWVQWQRYSFSDIVSSQSTMHRIKTMNLDKAYNKYVDSRVVEIMKELQKNYNENPTKENFYRLAYTNPDGMELTAGITTNYLQEKTVYLQRKNHKLEHEWKPYTNWLKSLPFSELIIEN